MSERTERRLQLLKKREYRKQRRSEIPNKEVLDKIKEESDQMRSEGEAFAFAARLEEPVFYEDELFGFNRMYVNPMNSSGRFGNLVPDYSTILSEGLDFLYEKAKKYESTAEGESLTFYRAVIACYEALFDLIERYRVAADKAGCTELAAALTRVPRKGATDYYEALVTLKAVIYALRLENTVHLPLGRFDLYMKPYFDASIAKGATEEELFELTEMFFIDLNLDTDIYIGMQQGDNGQSMVLGGTDREGNECFSELSEICLAVSERLNLIDPKINLRVNKNTPISLYERGTRLTKKGLGFPQYCNDDVAIPFLTSLGYDIEDARDYAVAACWEFITTGCGGDIPNIKAVNLPAAVERATKKGLATAECFDDFLAVVKEELEAECEHLMNKCINRPKWKPSPLLSSMVAPCLDNGKDILEGGAKYNNYGFHGVGISSAADAVAAIKELVFEQKAIDKNALLDALEKNFEGCEELRQTLLSAPKMGNNDDRADLIACRLMDICTETVNGRDNGHGGVFRMGTGSAMEYVLSAKKVGATADGRRAGENFGCSFSPSLQATVRGPLSAIQSFTKYDLSKICNGGPFTIEVHDTVFRNEEGERKVAALVKTFIDLGGHQIQINAINRDRLLQAQKDPESDPNLIVRVWGWSGYFNELDRCYQDHIIARVEHRV